MSMDDNYDDGALQRDVTNLENQVGDLAYDVGVTAGRLDTRIDDVTKSLEYALKVVESLALRVTQLEAEIRNA